MRLLDVVPDRIARFRRLRPAHPGPRTALSPKRRADLIDHHLDVIILRGVDADQGAEAKGATCCGVLEILKKDVGGSPETMTNGRGEVGVSIASSVTAIEWRGKEGAMILAASQQYFWYFGYPTPLAPAEDRSA